MARKKKKQPRKSWLPRKPLERAPKGLTDTEKFRFLLEKRVLHHLNEIEANFDISYTEEDIEDLVGDGVAHFLADIQNGLTVNRAGWNATEQAYEAAERLVLRGIPMPTSQTQTWRQVLAGPALPEEIESAGGEPFGREDWQWGVRSPQSPWQKLLYAAKATKGQKQIKKLTAPEIEIDLTPDEIRDILRTMSFRDREVLNLRFGLADGYDQTLETIGRIFKVTTERARQYVNRALDRFRNRLLSPRRKLPRRKNPSPDERIQRARRENDYETLLAELHRQGVIVPSRENLEQGRAFFGDDENIAADVRQHEVHGPWVQFFRWERDEGGSEGWVGAGSVHFNATQSFEGYNPWWTHPRIQAWLRNLNMKGLVRFHELKSDREICNDPDCGRRHVYEKNPRLTRHYRRNADREKRAAERYQNRLQLLQWRFRSGEITLDQMQMAAALGDPDAVVIIGGVPQISFIQRETDLPILHDRKIFERALKLVSPRGWRKLLASYVLDIVAHLSTEGLIALPWPEDRILKLPVDRLRAPDKNIVRRQLTILRFVQKVAKGARVDRGQLSRMQEGFDEHLLGTLDSWHQLPLMQGLLDVCNLAEVALMAQGQEKMANLGATKVAKVAEDILMDDKMTFTRQLLAQYVLKERP